MQVGKTAAPFESIERRLATTEPETKRNETTIGDAEATARFAIAKIVVIAYVVIISLIFVVLACDALFNHRYDVFYTNAFEPVKIAVIPIVTYVLGYYSARSTRQGNPLFQSRQRRHRRCNACS